MTYEMDAPAVARLDAYFAQVGAHLRDKRKRESFAMYALGLLGDSERKSVDPMAARVRGRGHVPRDAAQDAPLRRAGGLG